MMRIVRGTRPATPATLLLTSLLACAQDPAVRTRAFPANDHVATTPQAGIELLQARYEPQTVRLTVRLRNLGSTTVVFPRDGILLAYEGLEYPLAPPAAARLPSRIDLNTGDERSLQLAFRLARPMTRRGLLRFRGLRDASGVLDSIALRVPAAISDGTKVVER